MNIAAEQRAQRQAAAVQRLVVSRARLRTRLVKVKPVGGLGGWGSRLAGLSQQVAVLVQRHPGFSAGGAVLLGALLVRARPWRMVLSTGIWGMLMPRALPILAATLTASRLGQWADLITQWMKADEPAPAHPTGAAATPGMPEPVATPPGR